MSEHENLNTTREEPLFEQFDSRRFRHVLGKFATGVCVVTARNARDECAAITVNSFTSVSLEPPLILWCLGRGSSLFDWFEVEDPFVVSVLRDDQQHVSQRFANASQHHIDAGVFSSHLDGVPAVDGAIGHLGCRVQRRIEAGDHDIIIGEVERLVSSDRALPLVYFGGRYHNLDHD